MFDCDQCELKFTKKKHLEAYGHQALDKYEKWLKRNNTSNPQVRAQIQKKGTKIYYGTKRKDKGKLEHTFVNDMELIEKSQKHDLKKVHQFYKMK